MYATVQALAWQRPPAPLLEEMRRASATRYLLIAAGGKPLETEFNRYFAEQIGPRVQLWVVPGVGHVGALGRYPAEYEQRVIAFFDETLLPR